MSRARLATAALLAGLVLAPGAQGPAVAAAPARLLVTTTEFRLVLSRVSVPHGAAIVQLANRGEDAHDLVARRLDRRGRETGAPRSVPETQAGAVGLARLTLRPGRYVLFCSLPGHRARGMQAHLRVRG